MSTILPWTEKYRPVRLEQVILDPELYKYFDNCVKNKIFPHMILYGPPGTGKTSLVKAVGYELFGEHYIKRLIEFNASDDRGIVSVRGKITRRAKEAINTTLTNAKGELLPAFKIIVLDEADSMTEEAQDALRIIIEEYSMLTRFVFICNYPNKITAAIKSRCTIHSFKKLNTNIVISRLKIIMENENIQLNDNLLETLVIVSNGDMRKSIVLLQNLRYKIERNNFLKKNLKNISEKELHLLQYIDMNNVNTEITNDDIYELMPIISPKTADIIIKKIINIDNLKACFEYSKEWGRKGYPIDDFIYKILKRLIEYSHINDTAKKEIMLQSMEVIGRIKKGSDDNIQLMEFFNILYKNLSK